MFKYVRSSLVLLAALTLLTGIVYPLLVTAVGQLAFPFHANGSIVQRGGQAMGSELIGQSFAKPEHFWGRLSATGPVAYNARSSSGSNYGPSNPALKKAVEARLAMLRQYPVPSRQVPNKPVPVDLVTASGSGLDPHISPAAAEFQVTRVAAANIMSEEKVRELIREHTEGAQFGVLGEPRVNVLRLNLAIDRLRTAK